MKLWEHLTTVTKFSKAVALGLFIVMPVIAFTAGMHYQRALDDYRLALAGVPESPHPPLPTPPARPPLDSVNVSTASATVTVSADGVVSVIDSVTNHSVRLMTVPDAMIHHYHAAEYHNGHVYILRSPPSGGGAELWEYDGPRQGRRLAAQPDIDFRVTADEQKIYLKGGDDLMVLNQHGDTLRTVSGTALVIKKNDGLNYSFVAWDDHTVWMDNTIGPRLAAVAKVDVDTGAITFFDMTNITVGPDYALNTARGLVAFSNYPTMFDTTVADEYKKKGAPVVLKLYNLQTKTTTEIARSTAKQFSPQWVDARTLRYDDPAGGARITKIID